MASSPNPGFTRSASRERKVILFVLLTALLSVLPLPGMSFGPDASASTSEVGALSRYVPTEGVGPGRIVVGEHSTDPFTLVAVTFDRDPESDVTVRVKSDGLWGEWRELHLEGDAGPDGSTSEAQESTAPVKAITGTEPFFVGSADGYEIALDPADVDSANVVLVRESMARVTADSTPVVGAAAPPIAGLKTRASWGARPAKSTPNYAAKVQLAVVHHSESSNDYSEAGVPAALRSIQAYHMDGRGWDDIAYNFVVDKFGGIWEGRGGGIDRAVVGAHAQGFNTGSVGVMVLGSYTSIHPSSASLESVSHVVGWKLAQYDAAPTGSVTVTSGGSPKYAAGTVVTVPRVVGHRDVGLTSCPGTIWSHLDQIRTRALDYFTWYSALLAPKGALEKVTGGSGTVTVQGWAIDRSTADPTWIRVSVGSQTKSLYATISRPDIAAAQGGDGMSGFSGTFTGVPPGMQNVCATVKGSLGNDTRLGCRWVLVEDPSGQSPVGRFDHVVTTPGQIHTRGWALDPTSRSSLRYDLLVDGVARWSSVADETSSSVPEVYRPWHGTNRQFTASAVAVPAGPHTVCVRGRDFEPGQDALLDCRVVEVPPHVPGGVLESVGSTRSGKLELTGWALDLESTEPVKVTVAVGRRRYTVTADRRRDDIAALYPGYGANHGFAISAAADPGEQPYCVHAVNLAGGSDGRLACGTVQIVK